METLKAAITEYIPQRPPMVMIDELKEATEHEATSSFKILADNIFVDNGKFAEPGLIENVAQTAAAMVGYQCKIQNVPVPVGFIAAVKNLSINSIPDVHSSIQTNIKVTNQVMDVTIVEGVIRQNEKILCNCEMRILIQRSSSSN